MPVTDPGGAGNIFPYSLIELPESDDKVQTRLDVIAEQNGGSSVHLGKDSVHLKTGSERLKRLRSFAGPIEGKRKVPAHIMEDVILKLCKRGLFEHEGYCRYFGSHYGNLENPLPEPNGKRRASGTALPGQT